MSERTGYYFDIYSFRSSARVRLMSFETRAVYRDILDEIWLSGSVENDPRKVAQLCGIPEEIMLRAWPTIYPMLTPTDQPNRLTHDRMEIERQRRDEYRLNRSEFGKKGGKAKALSLKQRRLFEKSGTSQTIQEQDQEQVREERKLKESLRAGFERLWMQYPAKDGRKEAEKHFKASVKTLVDLADCEKALANYIEHLRRETWKKPKNGKTWFNNWRDWVDYEGPSKLGQPNKPVPVC